MFVFIVTDYGCNSTPGDIYTPRSKLFLNYAEARSYYASIRPKIDPDDENASHYINPSYDPNSTNTAYIVIEYVTLRGKRSEGVVIARYGIV
jgi:hypothetical protein